jgi:hypothetical protein
MSLSLQLRQPDLAAGRRAKVRDERLRLVFQPRLCGRLSGTSPRMLARRSSSRPG